MNIRHIIKAAKKAYSEDRLPSREKCCGKCAFREGSLERCEPIEWEQSAEAWADGQLFLCHEGIPGHPQQIAGEQLSVCAGWKALEGKPLDDWLRLGYTDGRRPDDKYNAGYSYMPSNDDLDEVIEQWCKPCDNFDECNIFVDASMVHQGFAGQEPEEWIHDSEGKPICTKRVITDA